MIARLMQFYGSSYHDTINLPAHIVDKLWKAITVIEARDTLRLLKVADWPNLKSSDREKYFSEIKKQALISKNRRTPTNEELARKLGL
jgi:hypothetical protein